VLARRLRGRLAAMNPAVPAAEIDGVVRILARPPHPTLVENNRWLHGLLTDGVPVEYRDPATGETRGTRARLIDFNPPRRQRLPRRPPVRRPRCVGQGGPRGPGAVRQRVAARAGRAEGPRQPRRRPERGHRPVRPVQARRAGPVRAQPAGGGERRAADAGRLDHQRPAALYAAAAGGEPTLEALVRELLEPAALLDYLRSCVAFEEDERGNIAKKVAGYHQFRAVRKARAGVLAAMKPPAGVNATDDAGKAGVIWHTQGSGKSLTMLMLGGGLVREPAMANPTIVVVTDRNDLDDQLFGTFAAGRALLRQDPVQAESREHLGQLLDRASGGVVFTTIHKFTEVHGEISSRANVVVLADEAHRSQYGFVEGGAKWMRDALPRATFVGFTGTPINRADKSTPRVFGEYADVYDIRQAVEDGATVPIYYEPRIIKLTVDQAAAEEAEEKIAALADADESGREAAENVRIRMEELVGAPERVQRLGAFIVDHWEKRRAAMEGKAMVVTMSRDIAARLYEEIKALRPAWHDPDYEKGAMKVVVTGGARDEEPLLSHVRSKAQRKRLADRFKDPVDDLRLVIVVDMWLTGFDAPPAHTMYLDKPLAGHNLMQAIARVNRVYGEKPGRLVVDLLGLADQLADALATYAQATGEQEKPIREVQDEAVPAMQAAFEMLRGFFHGFDYAAAFERAPRLEQM
jgi:type I restriction enzyme R subunit